LREEPLNRELTVPLAPPEEKTILQRYLPIVDWFPRYSWKGNFRFDVMAALTIWALLVPEAMAYAGIAGVSPEIGLLTAPAALVGYAIFGSSQHLNVGPSSTVAILSASIVTPIAAGDSDLYLAATIWLAIVTGVFFVTFGLLKFGWVANFMAASVLSGFMVGLAVVIAVGQLDKIFDVESEGDNVLGELWSILEQFDDWDWPTIAIGIGALIALFVIEEFLPRLPGALIVMLVAIALSAILDWEAAGIHVVGEIPAELPIPGVPEWIGWEAMAELAAGAMAIILVGFAESYAAAKTYATKFGYQVDANQEMIGLGAANLGAGLSGGFVVDGSLSKTAAGVGAGQKSQMTSLFAAAFILVTIVALTWLFEPLPEAVLGAIVIHAVAGLIRVRPFTTLFHQRRFDFWMALAAFLGVVLLDLLPGIVIGIVLSLVILIYRASFPSGSELGRIEEEGRVAFVDVDDHQAAQVLPGIVLYRPNADLIFSNAEAFSRRARELLWRRTDPPADLLVVDCEEMSDMDVTGAQEMITLFEELRDAGVDMLVARLHGSARSTAEAVGVVEALGEDRVFETMRAASDAFIASRPDISRDDWE
jgi:high affinity sulfate transporter 1